MRVSECWRLRKKIPGHFSQKNAEWLQYIAHSGLIFLLSLRLRAGVQVNIDSISAWIPGQARNDREKNEPRMTRGRKRYGMTGGGKFEDPLTFFLAKKWGMTLWVDSCSAIEGWLFWGDVFLRKRGMTLLGETIMGGTEYYQKISLHFN